MTSERLSHHIQEELCTTRPEYRKGRHLKAVKVYTVNNESRYVLIQGVPSVNAGDELHKLCASFGDCEEFKALKDYPVEDEFTDAYLVKYVKIQSARNFKRKVDNRSFFGGVLHLCYAPEHETAGETREKLEDRRRIVAIKTRQFAADSKTPSIQSTFNPSSSSIYSFRKSQHNHGPNSSTSDESRFTNSCTNSSTHYSHEFTHFSNPNINHQTAQLSYKSNNFNKKVKLQDSSDSQASQNTNHQDSSSFKHKSPVRREKQADTELVVKNIKPSVTATPKFVPHQIRRKFPNASLKVPSPDKIDKELRKNAFQLGAVAGPSLSGPSSKT